MRNKRRFGGLAVAAAALMIAAFASAADATPAAFGAKLTNTSQPTNPSSCHNELGAPQGTVCTWVAETAFENGSNFKAPKAGTINKLKLVSCIGGSFQLQIARANLSTEEAKVVRNGPTIHYAADTNPDGCGGLDGDQYIVQTFNISVHVNKGDFIAVKAAKVGMLHCSGTGIMLFRPPLVAGGSLRHRSSGVGCDLMVRLQYSA